MLGAVFVDLRQVRADLAGNRRVDVSFLNVVEKGEQLVEIPLGDGVVFVVVALRATDGQTQPDRSQRARAVNRFLEQVLRGVDAAFAVLERVAVEAGRHALLDGGVRQQVAGDLLGREAVEGHIAVEGVDDPAPVAPGVRAEVVFRIAVRVRVARLVEPVQRLLLAEVRRCEQPLDKPLVGPRPLVVQEGKLLVERRRQAGQIERQPADQRGAAGRRRGFESFGGEPLAYEVIDCVDARRNIGRTIAETTSGLAARPAFPLERAAPAGPRPGRSRRAAARFVRP